MNNGLINSVLRLAGLLRNYSCVFIQTYGEFRKNIAIGCRLSRFICEEFFARHSIFRDIFSHAAAAEVRKFY